MVECVRDWSFKFNIGNSVNVIYIDFAKAFDKVIYTKLLLNCNLTVLMD